MNYKGGKNSENAYKTIINLIPEHDLYIEAFYGSGAVFKNKLPALISILIDKDQKVLPIEFKTENHKKEKCFQAALNTCAIEYLRMHISLFNFLHNVLNFKVFVYLDPPYLMQTRSCKRNAYKHELTEEDHEDLLSLLSIFNIPFVINCYDNELYSKHLHFCKKTTYKQQTRRGLTTETLYHNYAADNIVLHDTRYIGKDFREREAFKKAIENFKRKWNEFPSNIKQKIGEDLLNPKKPELELFNIVDSHFVPGKGLVK